MPRTNKKTRIKGLPAKIQLVERDNASGSLPTKRRVSSDNRTGKIDVFFDDTNTINFKAQDLIELGSGIKSGSQYINQSTEQLTDLSAPGVIRKGVADSGIRFESGQDFTPFRDFANPAVDALSKGRGTEFYSTGTVPSEVADGFSQPLWAKTKIEIDITPSETHGIHIQNLLGTVVKQEDLDALKHLDNTYEPLAFYKFDGDILDSSGNDREIAIATGTTTFTSGPFEGSQALFLDGSTVLSGVNIDPVLQTTGNLTLQAVIKPANLTDSSFLVAIGASGETEDTNILGSLTVNRLQNGSIGTLIESGNGANDDSSTAPNLLSANEWHHVAAVREGSETTFYIDGYRKSSFFHDGSPEAARYNGLQRLFIGSHPDGGGSYAGSYFSGSVSNVQVIDRALTWNEIKAESEKIVIPVSGGQSNNYPMAYWNKTTKKWEGVGKGYEFDNYRGEAIAGNVEQMYRFLLDQPVGFGASTIGPIEETYNQIDTSGFARPITIFGFPYHQKFNTDADNHINMSDYINEPFLLEKIVLYWSGSYNHNYYRSANNDDVNQSILTFFILNERNFSIGRPETDVEYFSSVGRNSFSTNLFATQNAISRDLITYVQMSQTDYKYASTSSLSSSFTEGQKREYNYEPLFISGGNPTLHFDDQFEISGVVKSPIYYNEGATIKIDQQIDVLGPPGSQFVFPASTEEPIESWRNFGRNVSQDFGKNLVNAFESPEVDGFSESIITLISGSSVDDFSYDDRFFSNNKEYAVNKRYDKPNPYLLQPSDKLIFGWQLPLTLTYAQNRYSYLRQTGTTGFPDFDPIYSSFEEYTFNGVGPELSWSQGGIHKVVLYGSKISEGKEQHDTLNQNLTSVSIHEVIGND